jgi:hypothetical protein
MIPKSLFDSPIPDEVLSCLKPPWWKLKLIHSLLRREGLLTGKKGKLGRVGFALASILLHDDLSGLRDSIFPGRIWMREQYQFDAILLLPYYHLRRILGLLFRRLAT